MLNLFQHLYLQFETLKRVQGDNMPYLPKFSFLYKKGGGTV